MYSENVARVIGFSKGEDTVVSLSGLAGAFCMRISERIEIASKLGLSPYAILGARYYHGSNIT